MSFRNPYNFVPAIPRSAEGPFGDSSGPRHDELTADLYTGLLTVEMRVETPLLLTEEVSREQGHSVHDLLQDEDGKPLLRPTSIKGMLSTAFECVTNSRLRVFDHRRALGFRPEAGNALALVPFRVTNGRFMLLLGRNSDLPRYEDRRFVVPDGLMYAAWVSIDSREGVSPALSAVSHGDQVTCWIQRFGRGPFQYDRVVAWGQEGVERPAPLVTKGLHIAKSTDLKEVTGWACLGGKSFPKKHDDRVFFGNTRDGGAVNDGHIRRWEDLIVDYQDVFSAGNRGPNRTVNAGRHVGQKEGRLDERLAKEERQLKEGTLGYALLNQNGQVSEVYPVMISRHLFELSPNECLNPSLHPAAEAAQLSPADRVFGWVADGGHPTDSADSAYRGNLRIRNVSCVKEVIVNSDLALSILGNPKPAQARFYSASGPGGRPFRKGGDQNRAFSRACCGLRGRKVYPHHRNWANSNPATQPNKSEAFRFGQTRDSQNKTVKRWLGDGSLFTFVIDIKNLNLAELGALIWLLDLGEGRFHRLGGGKPLGFGSVRLSLVGAQVASGAAWAGYFSDLSDASGPVCEDIKMAALNAFKRAVVGREVDEEAVEQAFNQDTCISSFIRACEGYNDDLPIHYPRRDPERMDSDENFKWFVDNERRNGKKLSLDAIENDQGLPYNPTEPTQETPRNHHRPQGRSGSGRRR